MSFYTNKQTKLYYETHGEGQPLLIVPGGGTDGRYYLSLVDTLKKNFKVILPDPRGCGRSAAGETPFSFDLFTSDILSLLNHLEVTSVHVMGHSMGGMIAQHFTSTHSELVDKLVLFATSNKLSPLGKHCCNTAAIVKNDGSLKAFMHVIAIWNFTDSFLNDPNNLSSLISGAVDDPYPLETKSLIAQMKIIDNFDSSKLLGKINAPSLVLGCDNDILFPVKAVKKLTELLPNAKYHVIANASHSAHLEQPELISSVIAEFLTG
jgi:3-oxoadipate enol-lactonase